ncbi:MAG: hypothetical protein ACRDUV_03970 [Pseudonocardiaceae bacterium]
MTPTNPASTVTIRQAPGSWPSLVGAECTACGWTGPVRDLNNQPITFTSVDRLARRDADDYADHCEATR